MPDSTYCSGNFDYKRDGVPTEIGWVYDLVQHGEAVPSEMMCPSNPAVTSKAVEELLGSPITDFANSACFDRLGETEFVNSSGTTIKNVAREIADTPAAATPGSSERAEIIMRKMIENGFNTNYAASWFLVRTGFDLDSEGNPIKKDASCSDDDPRGRNMTIGPLTSTYADGGKAPKSSIPFLCDATPTGYLSADLSETMTSGALYTTPIVGVPKGSTVQIDITGDGLDDVSNPFYMEMPSFPSGSIGDERTGADGWKRFWDYYTRQDYRGIMPLHQGVANCLMADGSVQQLYDRNRDQYINNGFEINPGGQLIWTTDDVETDKLELASFYSLFSKGPQD